MKHHAASRVRRPSTTWPGFDRAKVEAELRRRGYDPRPHSRLGWTIQDPEGMRIGVAVRGWAEHVSRNCDGDPAKCPAV